MFKIILVSALRHENSIILGVPKLTATSLVHSELGIEYLQTRMQNHCACQMYKIDHNECPSPLQNLFHKRSQISQRNSKQGIFQLPKCRLEMSKHCFSFRGVKV